MNSPSLSATERSATRSTRILFWFCVTTVVSTIGRDVLHGDATLDPGLALQLAAVFMWGAFAAHAILAPAQRDRVLALRLGVALELVRAALVFAWFRLPVATVWLPGIGLGAGAIGVEMVTLARVGGPKRLRSWARLQLILLAPLSAVAFIAGLATLGHGHMPASVRGSLTYDRALYAFDGTLGLPPQSTPSAVVGQLFANIPLLDAVCSFVYLCEPLLLMAMMAGYVKSQLHRREPAVPDPLIAYLVGGLVVAVTFSLCPAAGPVFAFGKAFPANMPDPWSVSLAMSSVRNEFPRNCLPSGHVAFAWLAYLTVRDVPSAPRWLRVVAASFAIFTMIATLGLGQHYLIDLVLAVPFLAALRALSVAPRVPGMRVRLITAMVSLGLLTVWISLLRSDVGFFRLVPAASWGAVVLTLGLPVWLARRWRAATAIREVHMPDIAVV